MDLSAYRFVCKLCNKWEPIEVPIGSREYLFYLDIFHDLHGLTCAGNPPPVQAVTDSGLWD